MATHKLTKEQQNAVDSNGSVLVSAAAGSGKTSVLTEKVVKLLTNADRPCDADRLLVVTFTNAAAAEMRARIESRLSEECEKNPSNKHLLKQRILLSHSSVCTIDSFCIDLVKENFYDLQIDPEFNIINAGVFEEWKNNAVTQIMSEKCSENPELYKMVIDAQGAMFGDDQVKANILKLYGFTRALQDPSVWLDNVVKYYSMPYCLEDSIWFQYAKKQSEKNIGNVISSVELVINHIEKTFAEIEMPRLVLNFYEAYSRNRDILKRIKHFISDNAWDAVVENINSLEVIKLYGLSDLYDSEQFKADTAGMIESVQEELKETIKEVTDIFYDTEENVFNDLKRDEPIVRFLVDAVKQLDEMLFTQCCDNGVFTFDMIEHMALKLLKSPAGKEIADRYDWVLVDEYQDVNELQGTIFSLLSHNNERLFAVGDVKQSIYGFRQADPQMFLDMKDSYPLYNAETYPSKVVLDANFRSRRGVCEFVNNCFGRLMSRDVCGMDYLKEDSLDPKADFKQREEADVEIHLVDSSCCETAEKVAAYIAETVKQGVVVGQNGRERPVSYGDFAVLMRGPASHVNEYVEAFGKAGIPVTTEKAGFWETKEIMTVCSALMAVNNPCDDIAFLSAIMAYPGGYTPDEVAELRIASQDRNAPLYVALCDKAQQGNVKAAKLCEKLEQLRRISSSNNITTVVNEVFEWLDIFNITKLHVDSENRIANLLRLLSVAAEYEKGENADLHSFCAYAKRNIASSEDKSAMAPSGTDAVRIMSIHKSKGLQFPICIISECDAKINFMDSSGTTVMHEKFGVAVDFVDLEQCVKTKSLAKRVVSSAIRSKNIAEEIRLLYVAMTRAEDKLVIFSKTADPAKALKDIGKSLATEPKEGHLRSGVVNRSPNYFKWIGMSLFNYTPHPESFNNDSPDQPFKLTIHNEPVEVVDQISSEAVGASETLVQEIKNRIDYVYPYSDLMNVAAKASVSALSREDGDRVEFSDTPSFLSGIMLTPAQRGTALHKFMQFCDFRRCEESVDSEAGRLEDMEFISEIERDALDIEALKRFFAGNLYARIKNSPKVMREQRFLSKLPVGNIKPELGEKFPNETVVIQGAADCIFVEEGSLVVLDFKSDRVKTAEELAERYASQLNIYAEVFSRLYGMPVKEKLIYSFKLGYEVTV